MRSPSNFKGLVLRCMDSYDSDQIVILQHFSRSTRFSYFCTAQISKFQQKKTSKFLPEWKWNFFFLRVFRWNLRFFCDMLVKFCRNFTEMFRKWQNVSRFWEKVSEKIGNAQNFRNQINFVRNFIFHFIFSFTSLVSMQKAADRPDDISSVFFLNFASATTLASANIVYPRPSGLCGSGSGHKNWNFFFGVPVMKP